MKISKETGRRENLIGTVLWILFIILYYCALSILFQGSVFPANGRLSYSFTQDLVTLCIITVSVIAGLLTARPLFRIYLKLKAYRVHTGSGWQDRRKRKKKSVDRETGL